MENTELRIGNLVQSRIEIGQKWDVIVTANDLLGNYKLFEPIRLTREWLLKFGFYTTNWDDNTSLRLMINDYNSIVINLEFDYIEIVDLELKNIKYVHQLQNLYHALTNEELKLI